MKRGRGASALPPPCSAIKLWWCPPHDMIRSGLHGTSHRCHHCTTEAHPTRRERNDGGEERQTRSEPSRCLAPISEQFLSNPLPPSSAASLCGTNTIWPLKHDQNQTLITTTNPTPGLLALTRAYRSSGGGQAAVAASVTPAHREMVNGRIVFGPPV